MKPDTQRVYHSRRVMVFGVATTVAIVLATVLAGRPAFSAAAHICPAPNPWRSEDELRQDAFSRAAAVFAGRVIAQDISKVTMRVDISWKGPRDSEIVLGTGARANSDGSVTAISEDFSFEAGKSYLVWLNGPGPQFVASSCSRTAALPFAEKEFPKLDLLSKRQTIKPVR